MKETLVDTAAASILRCDSFLGAACGDLCMSARLWPMSVMRACDYRV